MSDHGMLLPQGDATKFYDGTRRRQKLRSMIRATTIHRSTNHKIRTDTEGER